MPKNLKELNWPSFLMNLAVALCTGLMVSISKNEGWRAAGLTVGGVVLPVCIAFFSDAKKQLEG